MSQTVWLKSSLSKLVYPAFRALSVPVGISAVERVLAKVVPRPHTPMSDNLLSRVIFLKCKSQIPSV